MTITEALAELKTISKRIQAKREFIAQYLFRQDRVKDPLEKDGGSEKAISEALQAITDLETRVIELRRKIAAANEATQITVEGETMPISDWLVWRREVAPNTVSFMQNLVRSLKQARDQARKQGLGVYSSGTTPEKPDDIVVNLSEKNVASVLEAHENMLGQLDGLLSLKNATVNI